MLKKLREYYWAATTQFGFQPVLTLRAVRALPSFISDYRNFKRQYKGPLQLMPFLHDRRAQGGDIHSEYFLQDLSVARRIFVRNPERHVDAGSRVDGFVGHVACFRTIEVFDIRPIVGEIPGIVFRQADLMNVDASPSDYCDSLSCLHALEHFGLGRYGDKVDSSGWSSGLSNLSRILRRKGRLYLSAPVGKEKVVFNAHRVFSPMQLVDAGKGLGLELEHLSWVSGGALHESGHIESDLRMLDQQDYALGIFEFVKK